MEKIDPGLKNLNNVFPDSFTPEQLAKAKTLFLKRLAELAHRHYGGKIQVIPKAPVPGYNWFNVWYTPGVSKISTDIRDNNDISYELTNRGNMVAVVSDSTRVLGDGNCTPPGGLGVMEGKAFLMKYLGGIDAIALCIDSRNGRGENDPDKMIEFVKMAQHSFGAINLEDISQPNCFKVLDRLREECDIAVWHDDAQGTACVILAGLINALKLAEKNIADIKIVMLGAGAANTTIARLIIADGANPENIVLFDKDGPLDTDRKDFKEDKRYYRTWEICQVTNPRKIKTFEEAFSGADVLIALSVPGPNVVKPGWIRSMSDKPIVFTCANPVPEIYPCTALEAGAYIVATGRGDFPNQVNNSLGFPGILKGTLLVRARKITDNMAIAAAHSISEFAQKKGINPDKIVPTMDETEVFKEEAAAVAMQAIKDGVARINLSWDEVYNKASKDINHARELTQALMAQGFIQSPPEEMLKEALEWSVKKAE
ncbi:MAG: NADP-dependent malic enzyme [Bacteroidales bacterium]|nr:NADP-dependent malic enzyme [Bacteroidales bacterium]